MDVAGGEIQALLILFYLIIDMFIRDDCNVVHAYLTDVWRFGLVVFSLEKMRAWRITDHLFYPEPLAAAYKVIASL